MIRKSSILITGASGEVGSELIQSFSNKENCNIITLDLHPLESDVASMVSDKITGNILDINLLNQIDLEFEIKEIYHLAAVLSTRAELSPSIAHDVNVNGSINLLELALKQSRSQKKSIKMFFPSSIAVYNVKNKNAICSEGDCLNPSTVYGCNKLYIEKIGSYYSHTYNQLNQNDTLIDFRSLRFPGLLSNKTTPSGGTSDFIPEMWQAIKNKKVYECFVNPDTRLPFLAMPDAINAIEKLMATEKNNITEGVYNVTSFNPSADEFYRKIKKYFSNAKIKYNVNLERQNIVDHWPTNIDDSLAKREWGWEPQYDLNSTVTNYLIPSTINKGMKS